MDKIQSQLNKLRKNLQKTLEDVDGLITAYGGKPGQSKGTVAKKSESNGSSTVLEKVYKSIRRSKNGANIAKLRKNTKLEARQLSNALYKLVKQGKIKAVSRGHYDVIS